MSSMVHHPSWGAFKAKYLLTAAAAVMLSACSNSVERFASNPSDSDPVYTASVQKQKPAASDYDAPDEESISSRPLESSSVQQPPKYDYTRSYKQAGTQQPVYRQPQPEPEAMPEPEMAPQPKLAAAAPGSTGTVEVGPGMTLYSIARANNLTVAQLAAANNIKPPYAVRTGQSLRIPGSSSPAVPETTTASAAPARPVLQPARAEPPTTLAAKGSHTVGNGETLFSLGRKYGVSPYAIADANGLPHDTQLKLGQTVKIPSGGKAAPSSVPFAKAQPAEPPKNKVAAIPEPEAIEEAPASKPVAPSAPAAEAPSAQPEKLAEAPAAPEAATSGMRWPVRGKVISGFGPKSNGLKNEGINIAVPEGTSIRAAESGVVAYAGNELKGYGNLVLVRHADGYVTAYAHAKELFVKRGDTVKRGDVIAKAGQTGSVSSPQLHFEVRKGATALDPMKYLSSSTAAN